jgi:hypothetical protein
MVEQAQNLQSRFLFITLAQMLNAAKCSPSGPLRDL